MAALSKLEEQHARARARRHNEAVVDLRSMLDQHNKLIGEGQHRPQEQRQMLRRRRSPAGVPPWTHATPTT